MDERIEQRLASLLAGQYELERELGRGGMGVVFLARDVRLGRLVAVKVLPPSLAASDVVRERFLREARTAAHLSHPNIVPVYRADEADGYAYFVMGYVEGESLGERLRRTGVLSPAETVRILREAAWALAYAHARGVVHRDVKPENLMLEKDTGRVVVTDFGIARDLQASKLTEDGHVLGTVHYMSPEQVAGSPVDGRTDLYALGVVGFECLAGQPPFDAAQASAIIVQHAVQPAPPLRSVAPDVPAALAAVIDRCLEKAPVDRFATGEELAEALTAALARTAGDAGGAAMERVVSEQDARAIWRRAAELQAEAATRIQRRYRETDSIAAPADGSPTGAYRVGEVERAAVEAGIGTEFVALAVAERVAGEATPAPEPSSREDRVWRAMLGTSERSLTRSRIVRGNPRRVLEAIGQVFPQFPWELTLRDTVGGHPLDGGVLVFDVRMLRTGDMTVVGRGVSIFSYRMTQIELHQVHVRLRPVRGDAPATEISLSGDLRPGLRKNWVVDRAIAAVLALAGAGGGVAAALGPLGLGALAAAAPAAGGALALGGLSLGAYRLLYRHALRASVEQIDKLLGAVEAHLRARDVFGGAAPPPVGARSQTPPGALEPIG